ncbi:porin [Oryzisolibacter sp. LB2S]|uniref:porin n=1 Tax=Alicycliphilus soli TaxID=3228789 RepID=UPI003457C907
MKKSLIALAVLAASGAAMAQSSVTLFGVVDAGVTYVDGANNWSGLTSGNQLTSRIGFRGTEDLGGGLKANFWLEAGLNLDNGDGNSGYSASTDGTSFAFKRRSTVGLQGGFGEVRLGRELTAAYNAVARYDVFGSVGLGASQLWGNGGNGDAGTVNNGARTTDQRVSNAVTYVSPNFAGFKVGVNYGFGEEAGKNSQRRYMGLGVTYDNGPLSLGLSGEQLSREDSITSAGDITAWSLGGSYDLGVVKLLAGYRQSTVDNFAFATTGADAKRRGYMLAVTAPVGPGLVKASYNRYQDKQTGLADAKADHFAVGYVYSLSKRTSVYGTYAYLKNKNNGNRFSINGNAGLDNGKQQGLQVGLTHSF